MIALTVCSAMLVIVVFAKIIGSMIPLLVKKINLDPALIANPAISSISDAVALSIYFLMASLFLGLRSLCKYSKMVILKVRKETLF